MSADDERAIDQLDEALDRIVGGDRTAAGMQRDTVELLDTHRRVEALDRTPGPDSDYVQHLMEDLMHTATVPLNGRSRPASPRPAVPQAALSRAALPRIARGVRTGVARFALAAVLLTTLGLGYVAVGPLGRGPDRPSSLPAAFAPAGTASPQGSTDETLLSVRLPADGLPSGDQVMGGLNHLTLPTGATATWSAERGGCCPGVRVDYVVSGAYTAQASAPARVIRAGSTTAEPTAAGTETALGPGDAAVFPNDATITYRNAGPEPVEMLFWILYDETNGPYTSDPIPVGATLHETDVQFTLPAIAPGPAALTIRRVTLPAHGTLAAPSSGLRFAVGLWPGADGSPVPSGVFGRDSRGAIVNVTGRAATLYVLTWEPIGEATASPTP